MAGGNTIEPRPDPWEPPRAAAAQAASIATGAAGVALLANARPGGASLLMLPDINEMFSRVAHVLGLQFGPVDAWKWGLALVTLSVVLNVYSFLERYLYAKRVKPLWDEQIPRLEWEAEQYRLLKGTASPTKAQGSGGAA